MKTNEYEFVRELTIEEFRKKTKRTLFNCIKSFKDYTYKSEAMIEYQKERYAAMCFMAEIQDLINPSYAKQYCRILRKIEEKQLRTTK